MLNPIGFATEVFDGLGRLRSEQKVFNEAGEVLGMAPLDTRVVPRIADDDDRAIDGPQALTTLIVESSKPYACVAQQYFRYTFARWNDSEADGCALEQIRRRAASGGTMLDVIREVAMVPAFRERTLRGVQQ